MERHEIQWEKKGTHEKHLSVLEFEKRERAKEVAALESQKTELQERVDDLQEACTQQSEQVEQVEKTLQALRDQQLSVEQVEKVEAKPVPLTGKVMISKQDYETLTTAAQKYVIQEKKEGKIQRLLDAANEKIQELLHTVLELKQTIFGLNQRVANLEGELAQERSFEKRFAAQRMEQENVRLKRENKRFRDILKQHNLLPKNRGIER